MKNIRILIALCVTLLSTSALSSDYDFYPKCSDVSKFGQVSTNGSSYGWVNTSSSGGFSCRVHSGIGDGSYPICNSSATNKDGNEIYADSNDWGWVKGNGFSCLASGGSNPSPNPGSGSRKDISVGEAGFKVVSLYVSHGDATVVFLPNGKIMLIDVGQYYFAQKYLVPFLENQGITTIDYVVITHTHGDHVGGLNVLKDLQNQGKIKMHHIWTNDASNPENMPWYFQNHDFGLNIDVMTWYQNSIVHKQWCFADNTQCKNERSLSLRFEYNGFIYGNGGDVYAEQQDKVLYEQPHNVKLDVYRTNHHMHGSVSTKYMEATDAVLFITSAEKSVKERYAYTVELQGVVNKLYNKSSRFEGSLLTEDHGHIAFWVKNKNEWSWKNYADGGSRHVNSIYHMPKFK